MGRPQAPGISWDRRPERLDRAAGKSDMQRQGREADGVPKTLRRI
jgi:hypothetical protein